MFEHRLLKNNTYFPGEFKNFQQYLMQKLLVHDWFLKKKYALWHIYKKMKCTKDFLTWLQISILSVLSISFSTFGRIFIYIAVKVLLMMFTLALSGIKLWLLLIMAWTTDISSLIFIFSQINDMPQTISLNVSIVFDAASYIYLSKECIVSFALLSRFNSMQTKIFRLSEFNTEIFLLNCYPLIHNVNNRLFYWEFNNSFCFLTV